MRSITTSFLGFSACLSQGFILVNPVSVSNDSSVESSRPIPCA